MHVGGEGALRRHFLDMGVIPGAEITLIKFAPMGDPMEFQVHGYELTLRMDDAAKIAVEPIAVRARSHENIIAKGMEIHCRKQKNSLLHLLETRIAVKQPCLIN